MRLPLYQIDAFADRAFTGNPACVMPLDSWLPEDVMQAIAAENNVAETAFFVTTPEDVADYLLRWFTPAVEVPLCGHATLASAHVLFTHLGFPQDRIRFATRQAGVLTVQRIEGQLALDLPAYPCHDHIASPDILAAMGGHPTATLVGESNADAYWLLVYARQADVAALAPDYKALAATGAQVIATAPGETHDFVSRFFAPSWGVDEDPVTGSAHCRLVPYWASRLGKNSLTARQISPRGGNLWCTLQDNRVTLAGTCVDVIRGEFLL